MKKKTENDFPSNTNEDIVDVMTSYPRNGKKLGEEKAMKKRDGK